MWEFDDAVTAPLHGFAGADDYWTRASSKPWLANVRIADAGHQRAQRSVRARGVAAVAATRSSPAVLLEQPAHGGHVGFMTGPAPGRIDWLPLRVLRFFDGV